MDDPDPKAQVKHRLHLIRSGFVSQGSTLAEWCRDTGHHRSNVYKALLGQWKGPKAQYIIREVSSAAGVEIEL